MTNSSVEKPAAPQKPKYKKKGPIRFEAIVPFALFCAVVWGYFHFFFDGHLRHGLEYVGTQANGAEVNIATFRTSFFGASLKISGIEVTHPEKPTHNRLQVGEVRFAMMWDAVLRGKGVVKDASILMIESDRPRKKPGYVLPPPKEDEGPSWVQTAQRKLIAKAREEIDGSSIGRVAKLLDGFNPAKVVEQIKTLKTAETIDGLLKDLQEQEKAWSQTLSNIPGEAQVKALQARVQAVDVNFSNPAEAPQKIAQIKGLIQESQGLAGSVRGQADALTSGVTQFGGAWSKIEQSLKEDRKALEAQLQLPKLDAKELSKELFGVDVLKQADEAQMYMALARQYMPEKKKEEEKPARPPRGEGKNYRFGKPKGYPAFWLQHAAISSKVSDSDYAGDFEGSLENFATEPRMIMKPAIAVVKGGFTKLGITGIELRGEFDHTRDIARDEIKATVARFPVAEKTLAKSDAVDFGFAQALGWAQVKATMEGERLAFLADSSFADTKFLIRAKSRPFQELLNGIVKDIRNVTARAELVIEKGETHLAIDSNLGRQLESGFRKQIDAKVAEARKRIEAVIQAQIAEKKALLERRFNDAKAKILGPLEARKQQVAALENQARGRLQAVENRANELRRKAENEARSKAAGAIKKKLSF